MQVRKFCVMLMVLATVLCGAWGTNYRWKSGAEDAIWINYKNWEYSATGVIWSSISDSSADIPGQNVNGHDNTDATIYINTDNNNNSNIVIKITEDITFENLYIETDNRCRNRLCHGKYPM